MIKLMLHSPNKIFLCASEFKMFAKTECIKAESCRNIHKKRQGVDAHETNWCYTLKQAASFSRESSARCEKLVRSPTVPSVLRQTERCQIESLSCGEIAA